MCPEKNGKYSVARSWMSRHEDEAVLGTSVGEQSCEQGCIESRTREPMRLIGLIASGSRALHAASELRNAGFDTRNTRFDGWEVISLYL